KYGAVSPRNERKLYARNVDIKEMFLDGVGTVQLELGYTDFYTIIALKEAMQNAVNPGSEEVLVGGRPLRLHKRLLENAEKCHGEPWRLFAGGVGLHLGVVSADGYLMLTHRSLRPYYHKNTWSISVDETMKADADKHGRADHD